MNTSTPTAVKPKRKSEGVKFDAWRKRVDAVVSRHYGLSIDDLPDYAGIDLHELWKGDATPVEGFREFQEILQDEEGIDF